MKPEPENLGNTAPPNSPAQELAWIKAIARGDRIAFEQLYRSYHGLLVRFLIRNTSRRDLVDEVVNSTLWAVWRGASRFRAESTPRSWIIAIAYRTLMKALRDQPFDVGAATVDAQDELVELSQTHNHASQTELQQWVGAGLKMLPEEQRMTLELAYFLGQSCEEIAEIMSCPVGTVKARMFHARVRLRSNLATLGGDTRNEAKPE
ncbi:MAG: sigma-70 family RNA polymerase sigma factor [Dokdonella sp.]|jgi:RNA polymerase sigma-70 factor, ECF subfamily|uniref:RNA polymerase sigma factor n=1 Tax=Dokdonella sp. TaxID=2291710 RepID=UPI001B751B0A|nr:sigma-70 family RNA polymerase sigma factor [Dokdonella sp.]MCC6439851.1 sigma-70 family RNA polymerase sigma factor [Rhodanobacteraceae bacterium]MBK8123307.1 sigma-70 family RNA polymerase sigma factor [Dokdonella sp.]MBP6326634.1 sigma-70 family RNA polymerase sigma factor [Dokdonella sp.]MBP6329315.1 sigma-70 family RNA polymerase sigma factor [Dokdonella sp.]HNV08956.1 sigma-70 family RNA polymerase sigma factor [Dokdonella sp.]